MARTAITTARGKLLSCENALRVSPTAEGFVTFGNVIDLTGEEPFSISLDFYLLRLNNPHNLVRKTTAAGTTGYILRINNANQIEFYLQENAGSRIILTQTESLSVNIWYNLVLTYDGSKTAAGVKIYTNNTLRTFTTTQDNLVGSATNTDNLMFGALANGTQKLSGYIMGVRFYGSELSTDDVANIYGKTSYPESTYNFRFNEGSGASLSDTTGEIVGVISTPDWLNFRRYITTPRTANRVYRLPFSLVDTFELFSYYDFRTGYVEENSHTVMDMISNRVLDYKGATALSSVYTPNEFSVDLELTNSDYFKSMQKKDDNDATSFSLFTVFAWIKRESLAAIMAVIGRWKPVSPQRSWELKFAANNRLTFSTSAAGTGTGMTLLSTDTIEDQDWHFIAVTNNSVTGENFVYIDGGVAEFSYTTGAAAGAIFNADVETFIGSSQNAGGVAIQIYDGKIGICGYSNSKAMTAAEIEELYTLTNQIGNYV